MKVPRNWKYELIVNSEKNGMMDEGLNLPLEPSQVDTLLERRPDLIEEIKHNSSMLLASCIAISCTTTLMVWPR